MPNKSPSYYPACNHMHVLIKQTYINGNINKRCRDRVPVLRKSRHLWKQFMYMVLPGLKSNDVISAFQLALAESTAGQSLIQKKAAWRWSALNRTVSGPIPFIQVAHVLPLEVALCSRFVVVQHSHWFACLFPWIQCKWTTNYNRFCQRIPYHFPCFWISVRASCSGFQVLSS